MDLHELQMLASMAEALQALEVTKRRLEFADAKLGMASGPCWDASLVDDYHAARDAYLDAFDTVQAYVSLTGPRP